MELQIFHYQGLAGLRRVTQASRQGDPGSQVTFKANGKKRKNLARQVTLHTCKQALQYKSRYLKENPSVLFITVIMSCNTAYHIQKPCRNHVSFCSLDSEQQILQKQTCSLGFCPGLRVHKGFPIVFVLYFHCIHCILFVLRYCVRVVYC